MGSAIFWQLCYCQNMAAHSPFLQRLIEELRLEAGEEQRPEGAALLDKATELPEIPAVLPQTGSIVADEPVEVAFPLAPLPRLPDDRGGVLLSIYSRAGEITVVPIFSSPGRRMRMVGKGTHVAADPKRCRAEGDRRARATVRRFCAQYRLVYMWTLTYEGGEEDIEQVKRHVERLRETVIRGRNGRPFPYIAVPELHADGRRWHVHMAVPFRMKHRKLHRAWGRGFVWCSDFHRRGGCRFAESRRAAGYLAKYIGKGFGDRTPGHHRYWRSQGYPIERSSCRQRDFVDAESYAAAKYSPQRYQRWDGKMAGDRIPVSVMFFDGALVADDE